jgi:type IV secretory pathway VirB4 component
MVQDWARKWLRQTARPARLSDFAAYLLQTTEPDWIAFARRLALVLSMYYGDGPYAPFMDGENDLKLGRGLTVLDVAGLEQVPWLETIASLLFFHRADGFIKNPDYLDVHKLLISDECSFTLRSKQAADAIDKYVRAYARFNAGVVMITQNMTDLESRVGRVIINNAGRFILFKLLPAEAAFACEQLRMPPHIATLLGRLFSPDEYDQADCSEGFIFRPNDHAGDGGVFRLVAPPGFVQQLGTSRQHLREEERA